ncbi:MAG: TonB family protein [Flavobacteriales bacterium]
MITIALLLALVLFTALLASGNSWSNVLSSTRNDLVFADRNRAYGAYAMRREHHLVMLAAFLASLGIVGAGLALPSLLSPAVKHAPLPRPNDEERVFSTIIDLPNEVETTPSAPKRNPNEMTTPIAVDTTLKTPIDTTSHVADPGPKGPIGPEGPKGPVGPPADSTGTPPGPPPTPWVVDVLPEYPGGQKALERDLQRIVHYPEIGLTAGEEGRVLVGFVVTEDGSMTDIVIARSVSPSLDAEALRAVGKLKKWKPGKFKGKDVKTRYSLPIVFKLAK